MGAYPERMQVAALPERRFLKTSRILAIATIFNIVFLFMLGTFYIYMASHADVDIATSRVTHLYGVNYDKKRLVPFQPYNITVSGRYLIAESDLREYIKRRHTIVWDNNAMVGRWGGQSWLSQVSGEMAWSRMQQELNYNLGDSRARGFVRDVHILSLENTYSNFWEGVIEVYDMPIPDAFNPACDGCMDNTRKCMICKAGTAKGHSRFRIFARTDFEAKKTLSNPYGFRVIAYTMLFMPVNPPYPVWDLPRALQPEL